MRIKWKQKAPREEEHGEESYVCRKVPRLVFEPGGVFYFYQKR